MSDDGRDDWTCAQCGREEHDAILVADGEIEVDVTCRSVYLTFTDDDGELQFPGMAFDHDEFERVIDHFQSSELVGQDALGKEPCPECEKPTNKFVGECEHCGHNRWADDDPELDPPGDDYALVRGDRSRKWHVCRVGHLPCGCGRTYSPNNRASFDAIREGRILKSDVSSVCIRRAGVELPDREVWD